MRASIHNPYLDSLGGGERYTLTVAKVLLGNGYKVDLEWSDSKILNKIEKRFDLDLTGVKVIKDINRGDGYDVCFWLSDGSIPLLRARNNILHFQFPFTNVGGGAGRNSLSNRQSQQGMFGGFNASQMDSMFRQNQSFAREDQEIKREQHRGWLADRAEAKAKRDAISKIRF